jgi:hypothetical protein
MKKTLLTLLTSLLIACGGATSAQPLVPPTVVIPPTQTPTPQLPLATIFRAEGCYFDLTGVSAWHLSDTSPDGFILDNDTDAETHIVFMQSATNKSLTDLAPQFRDKVASKEVQVLPPTTVIVNGVSAQQMIMMMKTITVWTTIFATGKHADVVSCGGSAEKWEANKALCDQALRGFHITE